MDAGKMEQETEKKKIFYSCGCSLIALDPDFDVKIDAFCLKCGNLFTLFTEDENLLQLEAVTKPDDLQAEEAEEKLANFSPTIEVKEKSEEAGELAKIENSPKASGSAEALFLAGLEELSPKASAEEELEAEEVILPKDCLHCAGQGWIKTYIQEWDRIRCHNAPCPVCHKQRWLEWSAGKWVVDEIDLK
ncbi:MAG: hypothetical protein MJ157_01700 [Clostridia bacterium]|nr:hypothetical protein [Clostridia bacterium]